MTFLNNNNSYRQNIEHIHDAAPVVLCALLYSCRLIQAGCTYVYSDAYTHTGRRLEAARKLYDRCDDNAFVF